MDTAITITAVLGFLAGAMSIGMWLGPALSRVRTERNRLQSTVEYMTEDSDRMTRKIAQLTADCVEFQRLAHEAQDGLDMAKGMMAVEMAAYRTTKRQLAAARGQITKLRKMLS